VFPNLKDGEDSFLVSGCEHEVDGFDQSDSSDRTFAVRTPKTAQFAGLSIKPLNKKKDIILSLDYLC
jgi:hypothetical protein